MPLFHTSEQNRLSAVIQPNALHKESKAVCSGKVSSKKLTGIYEIKTKGVFFKKLNTDSGKSASGKIIPAAIFFSTRIDV